MVILTDKYLKAATINKLPDKKFTVIGAGDFEEIQQAENLAYGHIDYGAKWAYGIVNIMRKINDGKIS
ncbi:hypothetical protein LCGC14_2941100 [marine sediment metagenome]|uniref:Uncharacterized protein n=1 Tax=marine sediment metagenome TaxID=412755 RepID=A0A0F8XIJ1_9ZZZZ